MRNQGAGVGHDPCARVMRLSLFQGLVSLESQAGLVSLRGRFLGLVSLGASSAALQCCQIAGEPLEPYTTN